jgi:hypothetical protein
VLKYRYVSKFLEGSKAEWATIITSNIKAEPQCGPLKHKCRDWTVSEAILLHPNLKVTSKVTRSMLNGWQQVKAHSKSDSNYHFVPELLTRLQAYALSISPGEPFDLEAYNKLKLCTSCFGLHTRWN